MQIFVFSYKGEQLKIEKLKINIFFINLLPNIYRIKWKKNVFIYLVQGEINRSFSRVWPGFDSFAFLTETGGIEDSKNICLYAFEIFAD